MSTTGGPAGARVEPTASIDQPRVSAVITTYNVADDVRRLSERVASMPVVDEIVIYDDGSSDSTPALLKDWAANDPRVTLLLAQQNAGVATARNEALAQCHGEFVWFADPDDEWSRHLVEVLYRALVETGADIAVGRADQRAADRRETHVIDGLDRWAIRNRAATIELVLSGAVHGYLWNKLLRRSVLPASPFPPMRSQSDFLGLMQMIERSTSTVFVPQVLYTRVERPAPSRGRRRTRWRTCDGARPRWNRSWPSRGDSREYAEALQYFKVWFFAMPAVNTPACAPGASPQLVRAGIRSALDILSAAAGRDPPPRRPRAPRAWSSRRESCSSCSAPSTPRRTVPPSRSGRGSERHEEVRMSLSIGCGRRPLSAVGAPNSWLGRGRSGCERRATRWPSSSRTEGRQHAARRPTSRSPASTRQRDPQSKVGRLRGSSPRGDRTSS